MTVSVLISEPGGFRVEEIKPELETLQKLVGGYIEAVNLGGDWHLYCDEEGKLQQKPINKDASLYLDVLFAEAGRSSFTSRDVLVGQIVWLGNSRDGGERSLPIEHIYRFALVTLGTWVEDRPITTIKYGKDVWVYDQRNANAALTVRDCAEQARAAVKDGKPHGVIEFHTNLTKGRWQEIRVDMVDDLSIELHDERTDRSYG